VATGEEMIAGMIVTVMIVITNITKTTVTAKAKVMIKADTTMPGMTTTGTIMTGMTTMITEEDINNLPRMD
jgi:hypothetical protein